MADLVGIRQYLNNQGIKDDQIGWDNINKTVQLGGKDFYKPTSINNGVSFGDPAALAKAYQSYTGNQTQIASATAQPSYGNQMNDLLKQIQDKINQPAQAFSYNQNTDPQYQAAIQSATQNAQMGNNANMAEMNRRGILNSTITSDRGAEIQQQEMGKVTTQVLPQLMAQAYQRYMNEQDQSQRGMDNLLKLAGTYGDLDQQQYNRGTDQRDFDYKAGRDQVGDKRYDQEIEYKQARDKIADERYKVEFDQDAERWGLDFALKKAEANNRIANSNADNRRQADNANFNKLLDVWKSTGKAPAGLENYGIKQGDSWYQDKPVQGKTASDYYKELDSSKYVSPEVTYDQYGTPTKTGATTVTDPEGLERYILALKLSDEEAAKLYYRYGLSWGG